MQQSVKIGPISGEAGIKVVDPLKGLLNLTDRSTDCNLPTHLLLEKGRCREMVGVGMRFQNPIE